MQPYIRQCTTGNECLHVQVREYRRPRESASCLQPILSVLRSEPHVCILCNPSCPSDAASPMLAYYATHPIRPTQRASCLHIMQPVLCVLRSEPHVCILCNQSYALYAVSLMFAYYATHHMRPVQ